MQHEYVQRNEEEKKKNQKTSSTTNRRRHYMPFEDDERKGKGEKTPSDVKPWCCVVKFRNKIYHV